MLCCDEVFTPQVFTRQLGLDAFRATSDPVIPGPGECFTEAVRSERELDQI